MLSEDDEMLNRGFAIPVLCVILLRPNPIIGIDRNIDGYGSSISVHSVTGETSLPNSDLNPECLTCYDL